MELVVKSLLRSYPVTCFIVLAALFSYGLGFLGLWVVGVFGSRLPDVASHYMGRAFVTFGPALAALVVTRGTRGADGVRSWLGALQTRRRDFIWWIVLPAATLILSIVAFWLGGTPLEQLRIAVGRGWPLLLMHYALQTAVVGVGEELGWRGWMLPTLLERHSPAGTTWRVAAVWYMWHLPQLFSSLEFSAAFSIVVVALSFLFTALWAHTQMNVLVVALAHGSFNAPMLFFERTVGVPAALAAWQVTAVLYGVAAAIVVLLGRRWWVTRDAVLRH